MLFDCSYCLNGQVLHARFTFNLITLVLQMKCTALALHRHPNCLNITWNSKAKTSCADAGLRRPLKFRAAHVFLHQHFQVVKGLPIALPNMPQSLEDQVSQHQLIPHSGLSHCTKLEIPNGVRAANMLWALLQDEALLPPKLNGSLFFCCRSTTEEACSFTHN